MEDTELSGVEVFDIVPTTNGSIWQDPKTGRFAKGNPGGPGNPDIVALANHRKAMRESGTIEKTKAVMDALYNQAVAGKGWAVQEWLNRFIGPVVKLVDAHLMNDQTISLTTSLMADDSAARAALIQAIILDRAKPAASPEV